MPPGWTPPGYWNGISRTGNRFTGCLGVCAPIVFMVLALTVLLLLRSH